MTTRRKPRISYDRSLLLWVVTYPCCDTPSTKLHGWQVAVRIGVGHQCPPPYPALPAGRIIRGVRKRRNSKRRSACNAKD